jgi:leucyl aminopeptidase
MDFVLKTLSLEQAAKSAVDSLIVLWPEGAKAQGDDALSHWVAQVVAGGDLEEGVSKAVVGARLPGVKAARVCLVRMGLGDAKAVRKAVHAAFAGVKHTANKRVALVWAGAVNETALRAAMQAASDVTYTYTHTKPSAKPATVQEVWLGVPLASDVYRGFEEGRAWVMGVNTAREWANRPANHATPTLLAQAAKQIAQAERMSVEVLGPKEVAKLGMGAFLAVAQGSEEPLRFIVLRYNGANKLQAPVVLVGKGITFDTGGISIKPAGEMDEMKFDMGGAASVLGTFAALGSLQPNVNVIGLIPACENMPDGRAVKPGDVVTSMSGQTIEVLNTDAEGRLVLCDALTYARRFKPEVVIDIATLTGACVIALGGVRTGLFSANDELAQDLFQAGDKALDPCWRMPLDDEYAEGLRSNFADMGNVAGRQAGAVTAAKFLQKFTTDLNWAHLDIAGTAWKSGAAKGGTGRPVGLLLQYLLDHSARHGVVSAAETKTKPAKSKIEKKNPTKARKA